MRSEKDNEEESEEEDQEVILAFGAFK